MVLFLISTFSYAQVNLTENVIIGQTTDLGLEKLSKVIAADLDGDGFKDVISLGRRVQWYKNLAAQGTFDESTMLEWVSTVFNIELDIDAADVDGDGDIDLVYYKRNPDVVHSVIMVWIENLDGLGNFSESQTLKTINEITKVKVNLLDVDNDGDIDITYSDYENIGWMENIDGNANFVDHTLLTIPSTINYHGYAFSDFNGDNLMDLVVDYQDNLDFYIHNSNNTVTLTQNLDSSSTGKHIIVADVDNDNDNDVVTVLLNGTNSEVLWYENTNGAGVFGPRATITSLPDMENADLDSFIDIAFKDLDGDSIVDLLFSYYPTSNPGPPYSYQATNKMTWYKNQGSGNFGDEQIIASSLVGLKSFFATDIDNDSKIDVVTASLYERQVGWFKNLDDQGTFGEQNLISKAIYGIASFDKGDLDRDGDLDIVSVSNDGKLSLFENTDGLGNFNEGQVIIASALQTQSYDSLNGLDLSISDVDGDEDLDIIVWVSEEDFLVEGRLHVFINNGSLNFTKSTPIAYEGFRRYLAFKDIDGDYDLDIVGTMENDFSTIFYHRNNGDGTFEPAQSIVENLNFVKDIALGDIDDDGDLDLVIVEDDNSISWFNNSDGLGDFSFSQTIAENGYVREILLQDITDDNYTDIIFVSDIGLIREIDLLRYNNSSGTFDDKEILVSTNDFVDNVAFIDFDNDNDVDILAGRSNSIGDSELVWHENLVEITGDEFNYGPYITILEERFPQQLDIFDIDNNGSLDVVGSLEENSLAWFENLSFPWNEISGTVTFADNVPCDDNNPPFSNIMIVADSGVNEYATFSQFNGVYQLLVEEPGNYTTAPVIPFAGYFTVTPETYTSNFENLGITEINSFCLEPNGVLHDLEISIFPITEDPRPGFNSHYRIVYRNVGPLIENGTITFEYEGSMMTFVSASETVQSFTAGEVVFNFQDLDPLETQFIDVVFNVLPPPTVNGGDVFNLLVSINGSSEDDLTPTNNSHGIKPVVVNSYDPNDIRVMEGEEILIEDVDKYLHYIIRFQNTGSASAININVEHELDEKLDWETMRLENLSHPGRVEIVNGSMVNFIFDDIHLPDSTSNEPASHGHIAYKIKPKSNVVVGDIFSAVADIYFDFNPPIITNTATTEIVEPLSVGEFNAQSIQLYPNPAKDQLKITSHKIMDKLTIVDINGRVLNDIQLSNSEYTLDVSTLTKGVYFLEIQSGASKSTKKFIKN